MVNSEFCPRNRRKLGGNLNLQFLLLRYPENVGTVELVEEVKAPEDCEGYGSTLFNLRPN